VSRPRSFRHLPRHGLVSVVIPVLDGERWLEEAIASVLAQTYAQTEVIAVDDGSRDRSCAVVRLHPRVRLLERAHGGVSAARNSGIRESRGEFVAFIDQDDRWRPDKLERQVAALRAHAEAGFALGLQVQFLEPGCVLPAWFTAGSRLMDRPHVGYVPGTMLVRRTTFETIGLFDEAFAVGSDADWLMLAREQGIGVEIVDQVVQEKRVHDGNLSADPAAAADLLGAVAASVRRRRVAVEDRTA
jgi:glycosyltransferase involved in cell wall biosynthesis